MVIKIGGVTLPESPTEFTVTLLDIDDDSSVRTADGTLTRDRIAVKRQIEMSWGIIKWSSLSAIMQQLSPVFFSVYYPDPLTGTYQTKTFYVGNRPCPAALSQDGEIFWKDLKVTLTEQ